MALPKPRQIRALEALGDLAKWERKQRLRKHFGSGMESALHWQKIVGFELLLGGLVLLKGNSGIWQGLFEHPAVKPRNLRGFGWNSHRKLTICWWKSDSPRRLSVKWPLEKSGSVTRKIGFSGNPPLERERCWDFRRVSVKIHSIISESAVMFHLRFDNRAGNWDLEVCEVGDPSEGFRKNLIRYQIFRPILLSLASAYQEPHLAISPQKRDHWSYTHEFRDLAIFFAEIRVSIIISSVFSEK